MTTFKIIKSTLIFVVIFVVSSYASNRPTKIPVRFRGFEKTLHPGKLYRIDNSNGLTLTASEEGRIKPQPVILTNWTEFQGQLWEANLIDEGFIFTPLQNDFNQFSYFTAKHADSYQVWNLGRPEEKLEKLNDLYLLKNSRSKCLHGFGSNSKVLPCLVLLVVIFSARILLIVIIIQSKSIMKSAFEVINQNQTRISCVISIILSLITVIVTGFLQREVYPAESFVKYSAYKIGYQDAVLKSNVKSIDEISRNIHLDSLDKILTTLKISCGLAFLSSFLHFSSSIWALYKGSPMSLSVWLIAHIGTLISLVTAVSLPLSYPLKGPLILNLFYAIACVDSFLTLLLLVAVYLDQRSSSPSVIEDDIEKDANPKNDTNSGENETMPSTTESTPAAANNSSATEEEELPPAPPPPTASVPKGETDGVANVPAPDANKENSEIKG